jgi:hypothetical protein
MYDFKVFTALTMKNVVFWDVGLCIFWFNRRFGGKAINPGSTERHIPEDDILQV